MNKPIIADLFVEDKAHEDFLKAVVARIAREAGRTIISRPRTSRGGHGRVMTELSLYQKCINSGLSADIPDIIFIAIDANCKSYNGTKAEIESQLFQEFKDRTVIACPDPHIERWYMADPISFARIIGSIKIGRKKCERDLYKAILSKAVKDAGYPPTLGGIEFAKELVDEMDFYRAGKNESSFKHFVDDAFSKVRCSG